VERRLQFFNSFSSKKPWDISQIALEEGTEADKYACTAVNRLTCITEVLWPILQKRESRQQKVVTFATELSGLPTKPLLTVLTFSKPTGRINVGLKIDILNTLNPAL
jgi:hypothetical protein